MVEPFILFYKKICVKIMDFCYFFPSIYYNLKYNTQIPNLDIRPRAKSSGSAKDICLMWCKDICLMWCFGQTDSKFSFSIWRDLIEKFIILIWVIDSKFHYSSPWSWASLPDTMTWHQQKPDELAHYTDRTDPWKPTCIIIFWSQSSNQVGQVVNFEK